jgi:integrase
VLPKGGRSKRFLFTEEEVKRIINAAAERGRTSYWLAAETGPRAGELFGLRAQDVNLEKSTVSVHQAVWNRQFQSPKTSENRQRQLRVHAVAGCRRASPRTPDAAAPKSARLAHRLSVWSAARPE